MKLNKQNKIVVGMVALVLALTVGYALFSQSLNIGGTASADGTFELVFDSIGTIVEKGSTGAEASNSQDKKTLTITVPNLEYPGAYVQIPVVIKNEGTVDAKLLGITTEGLSNDDMEVTYTGLEQNDIINSEEVRDIVITIKWKESSVKTSSSLSFNIGLNYEQVKVEDITTGSSESSFPVVEGQLGDNVYFKYDNGVINITGSGDMWDGAIESGGYCDFYSGDTNDYCSLSEEIAVKAVDLLNIKNEAIKKFLPLLLSYFISGTNFDNVEISKEEFKQMLITEEEGLGFTEEEADECLNILVSVPSLKNIIMEEGISSIRSEFFASINIDELFIANSVTSIGTDIFSNSVINNLNLGSGVTTLTSGLFSFVSVNNLIIPEGVTTIETHAFEQTYGLSLLTIPSSITTIEDLTIIGCENLTTIVNTTGKSFDWNAILCNGSGVAFETGSVELSSGQIINITK